MRSSSPSAGRYPRYGRWETPRSDIPVPARDKRRRAPRSERPREASELILWLLSVAPPGVGLPRPTPVFAPGLSLLALRGGGSHPLHRLLLLLLLALRPGILVAPGILPVPGILVPPSVTPTPEVARHWALGEGTEIERVREPIEVAAAAISRAAGD